MAEIVQHYKERLIVEVPILENLFKSSVVKRILKQRQKFEYRLMRREKRMTDFTYYISFLKSVIDDVKKMSPLSIEAIKLVGMHNKRIISLYSGALKYFKDDVLLWKKYISFLVEIKRIRMLSTVIDKALRLHGNKSDELYVFALKNLKSILKVRELYTCGLHIHKFSSELYLEAFKCELTYSGILADKVLASGSELNPHDPALNGAIAHIIFKTAIQNVKNDYSVFFKMFQIASKYSFASDVANEVKVFMVKTFGTDPDYWDVVAKNEFSNKSLGTEKQRIKKCLDTYDKALSLIDTDEMWDKYLTSLLELTSDTSKIESYKRDLLKCSMQNAHKRNKLKPIHYIEWMNKSTSAMHDEILNFAIEAHPKDTSILEIKLKKLIDTDKLSAYELFKQNSDKVSPDIWLMMVKYCSTEPQIKEIFDMAFGHKSVCVDKIKRTLGNEYLCWLYKNRSLHEARIAYNELITNSSSDASLCKTLVTIEIEQQKIDISKIRQHFTLACMQFGKTNIDLWMDRIYFELKHGSSKQVSSVYHQALTTLNNKESDQFVEEYRLKAHTFNQL